VGVIALEVGRDRAMLAARLLVVELVDKPLLDVVLVLVVVVVLDLVRRLGIVAHPHGHQTILGVVAMGQVGMLLQQQIPGRWRVHVRGIGVKDGLPGRLEVVVAAVRMVVMMMWGRRSDHWCLVGLLVCRQWCDLGWTATSGRWTGGGTGCIAAVTAAAVAVSASTRGS